MMDHRSYGETKNCKGCRYWSERIARLEGSGVTAMCLSPDSAERGKYKLGPQTCGKWASGHYGAVDSPGDAEEIVRLYAEEAEQNITPILEGFAEWVSHTESK